MEVKLQAIRVHTQKKVKKIPIIKINNGIRHLARSLEKKNLGANFSVPFRTNCNFRYN